MVETTLKSISTTYCQLQSDHALKNFRRDQVHGLVENGVARSSRDAELREEVGVTIDEGIELSAGHSGMGRQC